MNINYIPVLVKKNIAKDTLIAWAPLTAYQLTFNSESDLLQSCHIHHSEKKRQFIAGRKLLISLMDQPSNILYDQYGGPVIENMPEAEVSLSHSDQMIAAALSKSPIGIDIQQKTDTIIRVMNRFMNEEELTDSTYCDRMLYAQFCWSAKEAIFKAYRKGNIDFKTQLRPCIPYELMQKKEFQSLGYLILPNEVLKFDLYYFKYESYTLSLIHI